MLFSKMLRLPVQSCPLLTCFKTGCSIEMGFQK
jgi:hypothetical protein